MSCNGCRVLRKGCSETCVLRPCLEWISNPDAQSNATLFLSKFFGRSDLLAFISAVPLHKRPALFQSLLFEACGRTLNPVNGAVGLLSTGNWHVCQAAVETVLTGGTLRPVLPGIPTPEFNEGSETFQTNTSKIRSHYSESKSSMLNNTSMTAFPPSDLKMNLKPLIPNGGWSYGSDKWQMETASFGSHVSDMSASMESGVDGLKKLGGEEPKLLNLFV